MKNTLLLSAAMLFGTLTAAQASDASECKMYIVDKFDLPMAAVSVHKAHKHKGHTVVPADINWDDPRIEESGECKVVNGIVKSYKRTSK